MYDSRYNRFCMNLNQRMNDPSKKLMIYLKPKK